MTLGEDPAHVRIPETVVPRRVHVFRGVGVTVVVPVLGGPPQEAPLGGGFGQEAQEELPQATGLERPVREVPVKPAVTANIRMR